MERLKKCFRLHPALALALSAAFGGGLVWIFLTGRETAWYAYPVYVGAFYALVVDCVGLIPWLWRRAKRPRPADKGKFRRSLYTHLLVDLVYGIWQIVLCSISTRRPSTALHFGRIFR